MTLEDGQISYRLFLFDGRGPGAHAVNFRGKDDADALGQADRLRDGRDAELWREDLVVKVFEAR
jgi:hypothetical protein